MLDSEKAALLDCRLVLGEEVPAPRKSGVQVFRLCLVFTLNTHVVAGAVSEEEGRFIGDWHQKRGQSYQPASYRWWQQRCHAPFDQGECCCDGVVLAHTMIDLFQLLLPVVEGGSLCEDFVALLAHVGPVALRGAQLLCQVRVECLKQRQINITVIPDLRRNVTKF